MIEMVGRAKKDNLTNKISFIFNRAGCVMLGKSELSYEIIGQIVLNVP